MVAPDAGVDADALRVPRAGQTDARRALDAVPSPEPAVGPPGQPVGRCVSDARLVESVEHHLGRPVGHEVGISVRDEEQMGQVDQPRTAEAHRHARHPRALVPEDRAFVVTTVAVTVREHDDPVTERVVPAADGGAGPGKVLGHPQTAAGVGADPDRVRHVRFRREDIEPEPGRKPRRVTDLAGRKRTPLGLFAVRRRREVGGHGRQAADGDRGEQGVGCPPHAWNRGCMTCHGTGLRERPDEPTENVPARGAAPPTPGIEHAAAVEPTGGWIQST